MKFKRTILPMTLAITAAVSISSAIVASINNHQLSTLMNVNQDATKNTQKTNFTFYVGKNSGIPFGGKEVVQWVIKNEAGQQVAVVDDIEQDSTTNGKCTLSLPAGKYTAELRNSLSNPSHYIVPPTVVPFDSSNTDVNLTFQPVLWDGNEAPGKDKRYVKNDVIYNYKFNDINGKGFSFQRNKESQKLTILFFFKTTCPYSQRTLAKLSEVLKENGWENKVNVLAISSRDTEEQLRRFSYDYSPSIRYISVPNDDLKYNFISYSGYPAIAYVDYQGVLDATTNGEVGKGSFAHNIKTFSRPDFLNQPVANIIQPNDSYIDVNQPEIDNNGNSLNGEEPYLELPAPNTLPKDLDVLKKTKPSAIASVSHYDSRDYGIVTPVKNQGSEGLCWSYATSAASETSILREGLSPITPNKNDLIDISEHNVDFTTLNRNLNFDLLKLNPRDQWTGRKGSGNIVSNAADSLAMWNSPIDSNTKGNSYVYKPADYFLEDTINIGNTQDLINRVGLDNAVTQIKELIARYGAVTASYSCAGTLPYTNTASRPLNGGHAVTIVGWDDNISQDNYHPRAERNGGWICKNSWGSYWKDSPTRDGYFYISYDSEISDMTAFNYDKAHNKYDNNYYYDAKTTNPGMPNNANLRPAAAIYKTQKANFETEEMLNAINVGFWGEDVTVTAKIYKNVNADFDNPKLTSSTVNNPAMGTPIATVKKFFKYGGYKTLDLYDPIPLAQNETFSIVVELSNPRNNANLFYGADNSEDNMTFYQDRHGNWINPMSELKGSAARIKALTKEVKIANANSNDLKDADIKLSSNSYRYGDLIKPQVESVSIGSKVLSYSDYDIIYNQPTYFKTGDQTSSDNEIIGKGTITIRGKDGYTGEKTLKYDIIVGLTPDMQGKGWYTNDGYDRPIVANLRVKKSATKYCDIELPEGFAWAGNPEQLINFSSPMTLEYKAADKIHYRFKSFFAPHYINLIKMDSDNFELIPNEYNPNIEKPEVSEIPNDNPMYGNPDFDANNLTVKLAPTDYVYQGQPITPKITQIVAPDGAHPIIDWNFDIEYKNNNAPGIGKIIIKPKPDVLYWGQKVIEFTILNPDGSQPTINPDAPVANENLKSVDIWLNKKAYNIDSTIVAEAAVQGKDLKQVKYHWEIIDGDKVIRKVNLNSPQISINVDKSFVGKALKVVASCNDEEVASTINLNVSPTLLPEEPDNTSSPIRPVTPKVNIVLNQNIYKEGETINADAHLNIKDAKNVTYQWEIEGVKQFTTHTSHLSFVAEAGMANKNLKVTAIVNGQNVGDQTLLNIICKPKLQGVVIDLDKLSYQAGQMINAHASANPADVEDVTYHWEIVGMQSFDSTTSSISFKADETMDEQLLKVTATAKGISFSHEVALHVTKPATSTPPVAPQDMNIAHAKITLDNSRYEYTGETLKPQVTVSLNGTTLVLNQDYYVNYQHNTNVGNGEVIINGMGKYEGSVIKTFEITKTINTISGFSIVDNAPVAHARFGSVMFNYYEDEQCTQAVIGNAPSTTKTYWVKAISAASDNYEGSEVGPIAFAYKLPNILKQDLSSAEIEVLDKEFDYNGQLFQPRVKVTYHGQTLMADRDYSVSYTNNQLPGTGTITVTALANSDYCGYQTANFTIHKIANTITNFHMEGNTPVATALDGGVSFQYYSDPLCQHPISADDVNEERPYWVKAISQDTLTHYSVTTNEAIRFDYREGNDYTKSNIANADVYFLDEMIVYNHGNALKPSFEAYINGTLLTPGVDFNYEYQNNVNAGTGQLVLRATAKSTYYGSINIPFEIDKAVNYLSPISLNNGYPHATAVYGAVTFTYYRDAACQQYVSDTLPTDEGNYWVVAHSMETANYYSEDSLPFAFSLKNNIQKTDIHNAHVTLSQDNFTFDGSLHTPNVTVTLGGKTLTPGVDYRVEYFNHQNAGTATYVVVGMNQYSGSIIGNFYIHKAENNLVDIKIVDGKPQITTNEHTPIEITYYKDAALTQKIEGFPEEAGYYYLFASVKESANYSASSAVKQVYLDGNQSSSVTSSNHRSSLILYAVIASIVAILILTIVLVIVKKVKNNRRRAW